MADYDSESSSSLDFEDPWVRCDFGLDQLAAAPRPEQPAALPAAQPAALPAAQPAALPAAQPAALPAAQPAALPAAQPGGDQHHYPQHNADQHQDMREVPPPPPPQQPHVVLTRVPPPPPTVPPPQIPVEGWTIYCFLYAVTIAPGTEVVANIYLATGPEFPQGGPQGTSLVRFWWPSATPGAWHGRWRLEVPGSLFVRFNGRQHDEPARALHGAHFHGDGQTFTGYDYKARRVVLSLHGIYTVMRSGGLQRRELIRLG